MRVGGCACFIRMGKVLSQRYASVGNIGDDSERVQVTDSVREGCCAVQ